MVAVSVILAGLALSAAYLRDRLIFGSIVVIAIFVTALKLVRVVMGKVDQFQIDTHGVKINGSIIRWSEIRYFGAYGFESSEAVRLCYSRFRWTSWSPFVHELADEHPIARDSYELLMKRLKQEVLPRYPKLRIGELMEPGGD